MYIFGDFCDLIAPGELFVPLYSETYSGSMLIADPPPDIRRFPNEEIKKTDALVYFLMNGT